MAELSWLFGILSGLCFVVGDLTALTIIPEFAGLTWGFWLADSAIFMLISIAFALGHYGAGNV